MCPVKDETGKRYGRLLVLRRNGTSGTSGAAEWLCKCDCGNKATLIGVNLRSGATKSCGCLRRETSKAKVVDMTGLVFGRLTVICRGENISRQAGWCCRCECGNEVTIRGNCLRRGDTKSCGCLRRNGLRLPKGEAGFNLLLNRIRKHAQERGYKWELTQEQVHAFTRQDCYYCGNSPRYTIGKGHAEYVYNSIDRKDNDLGYTESNCVSCCGECNYAKGTRPVEQFLAWIGRVYNHTHAKEGVDHA